LSGWQVFYEGLKDEDFIIIAAAQDTGGAEVALPWYERAGTSYVSLIDENHTISSLYQLVNVPSAVWIDEKGKVIRIDEGAYATKHKMGTFEFGRDDYAPMVRDWVMHGGDSDYARGNALPDLRLSDEKRLAEPNFKLGVYFHQQGDPARADHYWSVAQQLNPDSWNYHRQDWSFTPEQAGENWARKVQELEGKPYYRPIEGLDPR
jgi:hypothetical protein